MRSASERSCVVGREYVDNDVSTYTPSRADAGNADCHHIKLVNLHPTAGLAGPPLNVSAAAIR